MGHPGFNFTRRSFHTVGLLQCPRKAYLSQMLGVRVRPSPGGEEGALAVGKVFHTLQEIWLTPEHRRQEPLQGTDGNPVLLTADDACLWYVERGVAERAVLEGRELFDRYVYTHGDDAALKQSVIGRPEPDVRADLRHYGVDSPVPVRYAAQYDAVAHAVVGPDGPHRGQGVVSVEHKSLRSLTPNTIYHYRQSGQILGQCAVWNARADLCERFGTMGQVLLNLTFKGRNPRVRVHRERIGITLTRIHDYARVVGEALKGLDSRLAAYNNATSTRERAALWAPAGPIANMCVPYVGRACQFLDVCETGSIPAQLYQITEPGLERAVRDRILRVDPSIETYDLSRALSLEAADGTEE